MTDLNVISARVEGGYRYGIGQRTRQLARLRRPIRWRRAADALRAWGVGPRHQRLRHRYGILPISGGNRFSRHSRQARQQQRPGHCWREIQSGEWLVTAGAIRRTILRQHVDLRRHRHRALHLVKNKAARGRVLTCLSGGSLEQKDWRSAADLKVVATQARLINSLPCPTLA